MSQIDLPPYRWFISRQGGRIIMNTYSGSLGTLLDKGCLSTLTFNYRVYVDISSEKEDEFRIVAESYTVQPWHLGGNKSDFERTEFEASEEGLRLASKHLVLTAAKYGF